MEESGKNGFYGARAMAHSRQPLGYKQGYALGRMLCWIGYRGATDGGRIRANRVLFSRCRPRFLVVSGNPFLPCVVVIDAGKQKKCITNIISLTVQPGTRPLTGNILLPSPLIDALFCIIEAHAGHGDQADPAKHLERDTSVSCGRGHHLAIILVVSA